LDRKGKVKAGDKGGRRYHTVPNGEDDEEEPHLGRYAGLGMVKGGGTKKTGLDAHEKALWKWVNVDDLDGFLQEVGLAVRFSLVKLLWSADWLILQVYAYFKGKGIYCIALARVLNLLYLPLLPYGWKAEAKYRTTFFVIAFSTFLNSCIDYSALGSTTSGTDSIGHLDDVLIGQCLTRWVLRVTQATIPDRT